MAPPPLTPRVRELQARGVDLEQLWARRNWTADECLMHFEEFMADIELLRAEVRTTRKRARR